MTTEVERMSQAAVDEAVTLGQYIAEDPDRLREWLAHVKTGLVTLIMQMIVESAWTADAYIRKAKEGEQ